MRIANLSDRLVLVTPAVRRALDVARASAGQFVSDPQAVYDRWEEFPSWAADLRDAQPVAASILGAPAPSSRQVLGIGPDYREHAAESGFEVCTAPTTVFTKWPSCLTGPITEVTLPDGSHTDWEVELIAVIGRRPRHVSAAQAWNHVAGLTRGQDVSERIAQQAGPAPQFNLGKSMPGFGPTGPWLVTTDELDDRDDLELGCSINGEQMQKGRTRDLIFSIPALIAALSHTLLLLPGDVLCTGTPSGVGLGRTPQRWLSDGDELVSYVTGSASCNASSQPKRQPPESVECPLIGARPSAISPRTRKAEHGSAPSDIGDHRRPERHGNRRLLHRLRPHTAGRRMVQHP